MTLASFIAWFTGAFVFGVVIMLGCVGETLTEKSGNLNLGVPGIMYLGGISSLAAVFMTQLRVRTLIAEAVAVFVEAGNRAQEWVPDTGLLKFLTQPVTSAITVKGVDASYRLFSRSQFYGIRIKYRPLAVIPAAGDHRCQYDP